VKTKKVNKVKKIKKGKKISKVKRIKKKPFLDPNKITVSKIEMIFEKFLLDLGIKVKSQHQIGYKFYDFIIDSTKVLIEFDGSYWHCDPSLFPNGPIDKHQRQNVKNDEYKNKLAASNGYTLIRVWENEFKENPKEVANKIKKVIKEHKEKNETF
jgi:very-short-patch-repair endonuclease